MLTLALKLVQSITGRRGRTRPTLKSLVALEGDVVEAVFVDEHGDEFVMTLQGRETNAPAQTSRTVAEGRAADAVPPIEDQSQVERFRSALRALARNPKLPDEAKTLLRKLEGAALRRGDSVTIVKAASVAAGGNCAPLRELLERLCPPVMAPA